MPAQITSALGRMKALLTQFSIAQRTLGVIGIAGVILGAIALSSYLTKPVMSPLFADVSTADASAIVDQLTGEVLTVFEELPVWPATHYVTERTKLQTALGTIQAELTERLKELKADGKLLEAQRLEMRVNYDLEMLETMGFTSGIESYSRHLDGRQPGEPASTLIDYFGDDFLTIIDESHVTLPQIRGMHEGDRSRKLTLVEHGFRLPSALDNRPLRFDEFEQRVPQFVYVSATPGDYELGASQQIVEQIIRPTGLIDPKIVVRPVKGQIDDLLHEIKGRTASDERTLVTTLTKKMSEDLTDYLFEQGIRVRYLHSDIATLERVEILRDLRAGEFDVLVGINLLREGLDLPEVSLVAILDADKEGFLRSDKSLIQTIGRAARNVSGQVHMYADKITRSMEMAISETNRRRAIQVAYNKERGLDPQPLRKKIADITDLINEMGIRRAARGSGAPSPFQDAPTWRTKPALGCATLAGLRLTKSSMRSMQPSALARTASST